MGLSSNTILHTTDKEGLLGMIYLIRKTCIGRLYCPNDKTKGATLKR
jgi:hypothetical protein